MSPLIVAESLTKWYGPRRAVNRVSFAVAAGEVVGLLGPNGSGKTTILRILAGYLRPTRGTARIDGEDVTLRPLGLRAKVGYVPEDIPLYDHMRVEEFLRFMGAIKGLAGRRLARAVAEVTERLRLGGVSRMLIGKLSRGYRQRVAVAQGLIHEPKLLILDEPTNGLDPNQIIETRELVRSLAGRQTVLVASHVLTEIERTADRVMILLDGELLAERALRPAGEALRLKLRVRGPEAALKGVIQGVAGVVRARVEGEAADDALRTWYIDAPRRPGLAEDLARAVVGAGFALVELTEARLDLERLFLEITHRERHEGGR